MALVYIAGYITRNDYQPSECEANFYYEKYGKYTNSTDRRKLKVSSDHTCRCLFFFFFIFFLLCFFFFFFFCLFFFYILFPTIKEKVCYKSSGNIFMLISEFHFFFNMEKTHASIFANIVFKNLCKHGTLRSEKEIALKVFKLS